MKSNLKKWVLILSITLLCVLLDQISKTIAINNLVEFHSVPVINNLFYWTLCYNTGGAWSVLSSSTWLLTIISILALGLVIFTLYKSQSKLYNVTASIFMGGLIGNLIDRLVQSKVTDFIDFVIFGYDFPVFNVSDICICISAVFIVFLILKEEKENEH